MRPNKASLAFPFVFLVYEHTDLHTTHTHTLTLIATEVLDHHSPWLQKDLLYAVFPDTILLCLYMGQASVTHLLITAELFLTSFTVTIDDMVAKCCYIDHRCGHYGTTKLQFKISVLMGFVTQSPVTTWGKSLQAEQYNMPENISCSQPKLPLIERNALPHQKTLNQ